MGQAKNRRQNTSQARQDVRLSTLLGAAALHLHDAFVLPERPRGACHYTTFALRHFLATQYQLEVAVQVGHARTDDSAWACHSWIAHEDRLTDLALHYPLPPTPRGDLVIEDVILAPGAARHRYALKPSDGVPLLTEADTDQVANARRKQEYERLSALARAPLRDVEAYLASDPNGFFMQLVTCWQRFPRP